MCLSLGPKPIDKNALEVTGKRALIYSCLQFPLKLVALNIHEPGKRLSDQFSVEILDMCDCGFSKTANFRGFTGDAKYCQKPNSH